MIISNEAGSIQLRIRITSNVLSREHTRIKTTSNEAGSRKDKRIRIPSNV